MKLKHIVTLICVLACILGGNILSNAADTAGKKSEKKTQLFGKHADNISRKHNMSHIHNKIEYVVGNPATFEEARQALAKRSPSSKEPLVIKTPVDKTKLVITNDVITDYDLNADGYSDLLEGTSYRIGYGTKESPYQWANFTKIYFGSPERVFEQNVSSEMPATPDIVDADLTAKQPAISDLEASALHMISVSAQNDSFDRNVAAAVHSVMTFGFNFSESLYFMKRNDTSRNAEMSNYIRKAEKGLSESLEFAMDAVKRQISVEPDHNYAHRLKNIYAYIDINDPTLPGFARVEELWYGVTDTQACDELYDRLLDITKYEDDPSGKAAELRERAFFIEHQKESGGLFDGSEKGFVAEANRYAREQGYENYAALKLDRAHGLSLEGYIKRAKRYLKGQSPRLKAIVAEFKQTVQPGRPVWEGNMKPLFGEKRKEALKKLGLDEEPKLSAEDYVKIAKAFYKDLGWDMDASIANGELVLDLFPRDKKTAASWQESMGGGKISIVIINLDKKNTLDDLRKFLHELGHALHAFYASNNADGSYWGGARGPFKYGLKETVPTSLEEVVFSRDWMDRYLSKVKGFEDPRVREILSNIYGDQLAFWQSTYIFRALWEINLYAEAGKSMEERLNYWGELGKKYFGYDDIGFPTSQVSYFNTNYKSGYVHPAYEPMYYVSYCADMDFEKELTAHAVSTVVEKDEGKRQRMFERLQSFLEQSGSVETVEDAISLWNTSK